MKHKYWNNKYAPFPFNNRGDVFVGDKARKEAEEKARQAEEAARAEQARIEAKYGVLTPVEQERETRAAELEKTQQAELERRAGTEGEALLREAGPITRNLLDQIASRSGMTTEQLFLSEGGEAARQLLKTVTGSGLDSIYKNELDLALQQTQQELGRRGITPTGTSGDIGLESMGRASVDAAIKGAQQRLDAQTGLVNTLLNLASGQRAEAGAVGERALSESGNARTNLLSFLTNLQNLDQSAKNRTTQAGLSAYGTATPSITGFQGVPIDLAASDYGSAQANNAALYGGLADIGTSYLQGNTIFNKKETPSVATERQSSREEDNSLERLLAFSGGGINTGNRMNSSVLNL